MARVVVTHEHSGAELEIDGEFVGYWNDLGYKSSSKPAKKAPAKKAAAKKSSKK
jgi:hypothetical protein